MLEIRNATKIYRSEKVCVRALDGVSLKFPETGIVFLLGRSGCGKTTLLNALGGLDFLDEGDVLIDGRSLRKLSRADRDAYRNTHVGVVFQEFQLLSDFSAAENIALALRLQGKQADPKEIDLVLERVGLAGLGARRPEELSGGQKQRVAIARALMKNPRVILADEPTGALDSETGTQIFDLLRDLSKEKLVVVVTHDEDFAKRYADRIIRLSDGRVIDDNGSELSDFRKKMLGFSLL